MTNSNALVSNVVETINSVYNLKVATYSTLFWHVDRNDCELLFDISVSANLTLNSCLVIVGDGVVLDSITFDNCLVFNCGNIKDCVVLNNCHVVELMSANYDSDDTIELIEAFSMMIAYFQNGDCFRCEVNGEDVDCEEIDWSESDGCECVNNLLDFIG